MYKPYQDKASCESEEKQMILLYDFVDYIK